MARKATDQVTPIGIDKFASDTERHWLTAIGRPPEAAASSVLELNVPR